jgi:hypothetical protein
MSEIDDALGLNDTPSGEINEAKYSHAPKGLGDNSAEKVIVVVANIVLILGCLISIIGGIEMAGHHSTEGAGFALLFGGTISSVITWALLMVLANISNNIRQIKHLLKDKK